MTDRDTSTSQKIKFPHWQREFEAALLESDPQKLRQLVEAAEAAIFVRSQALAESADRPIPTGIKSNSHLTGLTHPTCAVVANSNA